MTRLAPESRRSLLAFSAVTTLFFAWGFITSNNDPLVVTLRAAFSLNYTEALLTQIVSFLANGLLSLPAAWLCSRIGSIDTILGSLAVMIVGCLAVMLSTDTNSFLPILAALFVLAAGFTGLQVAANPLAAELGPPHRRHFRLNFAQAFNSLGVVLGVHFGSLVMLGGFPRQAGGMPNRATILSSVDRAYVIMAALLMSLLLLFAMLRKRLSSAAPDQLRPAPAGMFEALRSRWAVFGAVAIGLYVGAEVSIGSIMINFLNQPQVLGLPFEVAGGYLANFYWGGALCGRIVGTVLLTRMRADRLLGTCGVVAAALCVTVLTGHGPVAGYAALAIGFFNSIMFPTIFTITLERSGVSQSATSGLLCVAIFGGALLPLAVGALADRFGLSAAFAVPLVGYAFIALFAAAAREGRAGPAVLLPAQGSPIP
ncbi:glucose/galactose MFS transporter [Sphingomonas sp. URHD0057]|uniref:glucose/galactose MFS transporter n=1 Tax=Sphingomonas sp. URHD0057 TaxID=1380389 RepID=UPI000AF7DDAC|nr:glucose/galactose MFS transporter [Sphingomonas sp. URHD0057]